jgi:hypothetical protein
MSGHTLPVELENPSSALNSVTGDDLEPPENASPDHERRGVKEIGSEACGQTDLKRVIPKFQFICNGNLSFA